MDEYCNHCGGTEYYLLLQPSKTKAGMFVCPPCVEKERLQAIQLNSKMAGV